MLNWLFEMLAPSVFTKGIYKYHQGEYPVASRLFKRAAKWMPELDNDGLFYAYSFLVEYHLGGEVTFENARIAVEKLSESPFKSNNSYYKAEAELKSLLNTESDGVKH